MEENKYPILDKIHTDAELKALSDADAKALCAELRCFLVDKVTKSGGHLASNLGAVEISVAVHRIFDLPHDRVIFDVGHQSYVLEYKRQFAQIFHLLNGVLVEACRPVLYHDVVDCCYFHD